MADSVAHIQTVSPSLGRSVSIDQAAKLLNISRRTVYNRIRDGRLRTLRTIGGSQRVLIDSMYENRFSPRACPPAEATASLPVRSDTRT